jgi:hypothetical protein
VTLSTSLRIWFCLATAAVAAAVANPAMESLSDAGIFGRNDLTDHSSLDVLPTLIGGLLIGVYYLCVRLRPVFADRYRARPKALLAAPSDAVRPRTLVRLLPAIFVTQIAILFSMETAEQLIVDGHALGGTIWLGGPAPISLGLHAAACICVTFFAVHVLNFFARVAVGFLGFVLLLIATAARSPRLTIARWADPFKQKSQSSARGRTGERAPPLAAA